LLSLGAHCGIFASMRPEAQSVLGLYCRCASNRTWLKKGEPVMLNSNDSIASKIERLPINIINRNMAQANYAAAEASVVSVARAVAWLLACFASASAFVASTLD
jgi:hypothetical protein